MQANTSQGASSSVLEVLDKTLESSITQINNEYQALKQRRKDIADRQKAKASEHGGGHATSSDIIRLNVRGTELFASRDTLTIVKGSHFDALFSGRWEDQILRDGKGTVFVDIDPVVFKNILDYLYMVNISKDVPPLPTIDEPHKEMFEYYIKFLNLRGNDGNLSTVTIEPIVQNTDNVSSNQDQSALMSGMKRKLDEMEEALTREESLVASFIKAKKSDTASDTSEISKKAQGQSDEVNEVDIAQEILTLYLNGEIVSCTRATLCVDETSKLTKDLGNQEWLRKHTIKTEDGKQCILIEQPSAVFKALVKALVNLLHMSSTTEQIVPLPVFGSEVETDYCSRMPRHYFQEASAISLAFSSFGFMLHTSNINSSKVEEENIREWLESVGKTSKPKLLYRCVT